MRDADGASSSITAGIAAETTPVAAAALSRAEEPRASLDAEVPPTSPDADEPPERRGESAEARDDEAPARGAANA
jgi:hypothetical protein